MPVDAPEPSESWQSPGRLRLPPPPLGDALAWEGSLTRFLQSRFRVAVGVVLERQEYRDGIRDAWPEGPESVPWPEVYRLPAGRTVLLRDAFLLLGRQPVVFAQSLIRLDGLPPALQQAVAEGEKPLGGLFLAQEQEIHRDHLEVSQGLLPRLSDRLAFPSSQPLWRRRSLFRVGGEVRARILETFLPGFPGSAETGGG